MKKMMLFVLIGLSTYTLHAQMEFEEETEPIKYPMFFGLSFQTLLPQSTFNEKMNKSGFGGQLEYLVNLNQSPFYVGAAAAIANFGNEVFDFTDAEGFDLKWKTNSSLWSMHLKLRFEPTMTFPVQPYVSGQVGFNHFFTVSRLVDPESDDNPLERYVDNNDTKLSYGGSFGLLIPLDKEWWHMLDIKVTYLRGPNSSYYSKLDGVTVVEDSIEAFSLEESPINMLGLHIGVLVFIQ